MARYIGPKLKISRRFGVKLGLRTNEEAFTRRPYRPGEHGTKRQRGRASEYSHQLAEKQKARYTYGILERQFHRYYQLASKSANVGLSLLQLLETRLDTVLFRAGLTLTQNQARQLVSHGHVTVNGERVSIPSFATKPGMTVAIDKAIFAKLEANGGPRGECPNWLKVKGSTVEVIALPEREQMSTLINEQLIVEFYSR